MNTLDMLLYVLWFEIAIFVLYFIIDPKDTIDLIKSMTIDREKNSHMTIRGVVFGTTVAHVISTPNARRTAEIARRLQQKNKNLNKKY